MDEPRIGAAASFGVGVMNLFKCVGAAALLGASLIMPAAASAQEDRELVEVEAPEYPRGAQRRSLEGYVVVRYDVTPDGAVDSPEIVEASPEGIFDRAVLRALEDWRYAPAAETSAGVERRFDFRMPD